jgi:hypothetical protein
MRIHVLFLGSSVSASLVVPNPLGYRLLNLSCSSVRFKLSVSMNRPILWLAASRLNISASDRWPTAYTFPILELLSLSAGRLLAASAHLASSGSFFSRPSTCPALSILSVVALFVSRASDVIYFRP